VIVTAEVLVKEADIGVVTRIVNVEPSDHPSRAKALEQVQQDAFYTPEKPGTTFVKTFPYCEHPKVKSAQYGSCRPPKE